MSDVLHWLPVPSSAWNIGSSFWSGGAYFKATWPCTRLHVPNTCTVIVNRRKQRDPHVDLCRPASGPGVADPFVQLRGGSGCPVCPYSGYAEPCILWRALGFGKISSVTCSYWAVHKIRHARVGRGPRRCDRRESPRACDVTL